MKYSILIPLLLLWEALNWIVYNGHLLRNKVWILFSEQQIYERFYIDSTYFNAEVYLLVFSITSVAAMEFCLKAETISCLVRCTSRDTFVYKRWKTILMVSILYAGIHFALGYGLGNVIFAEVYARSKETLLFYGASAPLLMLFFLRANILYTLIRDIFQKKIHAMAGILALYIAEYFLGYYIFPEVWMPCKDVDMGALAYSGGMGIMDFILALVRQSGFTVFVAVLSLKYFERKDVIQNER